MKTDTIQTLESRIAELERLLSDAQDARMGAEAMLNEDHAQTLQSLKEKEEESNLLQRRIDLAFQATGDGLWEIKMPGDEVWFSGRSLEMLGYSKHEILPSWDGLLTLVHEDDRRKADRIFGDFVDGDRSALPATMKFSHKDGSIKIMLVRAVHQENEKNQVIAVVGSITDITELEAERAKVEELAEFPENNPNPVLQFEMDGEITYMNPAAVSVMNKLNPDDIFNKRLVTLIESGEELLKYEITSGSYVFMANAFAREYKRRKLVNVYLMDITERKDYERVLKNAKREAEAASVAKSDFLATMSHELRTPMNGILGLSELMQDLSLDEEADELTRTIHSSAQNLLGLINDILDFSKIEADELSLEPHSIILEGLVRDSTAYLRHMAEEKGLAFDVQIDPQLPDYIYVDSLRMRQIMNNLIGNAIKFTESGSVTLSVSLSNTMSDSLELLVSDTGIGIQKSKIGMIFNKFQTLDGRQFAGTGLGLAIVQRLVELMGGTITVSSERGEGTEFSLSIPMHTQKANDEKASVADQAKELMAITDNPMHGKRALSVDDHPTNLMMVRRLLGKLGAEEVVEADDGEAAVQLWQEDGPFDVIIMDYHMPGMDGLKATMAIRALESELNIQKTPIIIVTADAMKETFEKCLAAGVDDYVTKPVSRNVMVQTLCKYIIPESGDAIHIEDEQDTSNVQQVSEDAIDLNHLREFSDGEKDIEIEFYSVYKEQADQCIDELADYIDDNDDEWRKAAHKLKGASANLGAFPLSQICKLAEDGYEANYEQKKIWLALIEEHLATVDQFMSTLHDA